jgi:hypothetical protein
MRTQNRQRRSGPGWFGAAVASCLAAVAAQADVLVQYDIEGSNLAPSTVHTHLSASDLAAIGDGTTNYFQGYPDTGTAFSKNSWPTDATPDDYFGFSITVPDGFVAHAHDLSFAERRSGTGPTNWLVRISTNGVDFVDVGEGTSGSADVWHQHTVHGARTYNLTSTVQVRIYGIRAGGGAGTWRIDDVTLNGTAAIDDGTRVVYYQGFEQAPADNWAVAATNADPGSVTTSTDRAYTGLKSQRLTGTADGLADPYIIMQNVSLANMTDVSVEVAYAADGPDASDNLLLDVSYDNGGSWGGAGGTTLVEGYSQADVAFGETSASQPTTVGANPYTFDVSGTETQVSLRVFFTQAGTPPNGSDHYYVDGVSVVAKPIPAQSAPVISNYGGITGITATGATVSGHLLIGYPYPEVTVYWGPTDGGENSSAWSHEIDMGTQSWGLFETTLSNLSPGQTYYYRCFASNSGGDDWADSTTNFTTTAGSIDSVVRRMYVDTLGIATDMPLHIDRDSNGLPDRWEEDYLDGPDNDWDDDKDGDTVSNFREYLAGTDPDDDTSYMRIVTVDLAGPASDDVLVTWQAGDHVSSSSFETAGDSDRRRYRLFAADNDASLTKSLRATVTNDGAATHAWTDADAVDQYTSRFYHMGASLGGESYTNAEEWAIFVQDRVPTNRYLVCVPVNFANASSNNFNSQLGEQLARGLYAGFNTGDVVRLWDDSKAWVNCLLTTNAQGDIQWTTNGIAMDLEITPGRAMWVERSSTSAPRGNTVFAGRTFNSGVVTAQSITKDNGSWNLFGWPLPIARTHDSGGADNQLGFADIGTGGIPYDPDYGKHGDEIWIQHGNGFRFYQLLDNHAAGGESLDRRWWGNGTGGGGLADFSLEPGKSYYYHHTTNWSATNFIWTPSVP